PPASSSPSPSAWCRSPHRSKSPARVDRFPPRAVEFRRAGGDPVIVEKRRIEGMTLLRLEGVIKLGESAEFLSGTLERSLAEESGHVLIDFSAINYIDSTGIGELVGY